MFIFYDSTLYNRGLLKFTGAFNTKQLHCFDVSYNCAIAASFDKSR